MNESSDCRAGHDIDAELTTVHNGPSATLTRAVERFVWLGAVTAGALVAHALALSCIGLLIIMADVLLKDFFSGAPTSGAPGSNSTILIDFPALCTIAAAMIAYLAVAIKSAVQKEGSNDTFLKKIDATL